MKALSLIQPWATLVAIGAKTIETRDWPTDYRGPLAIHASKWQNAGGRIISPEVESYLELAFTEPFASALTQGGIARLADLPSGAVVAVARLVDVLPTTSPRLRVVGDEREFGNFAPGRYAWLLADVRAMAAPVPCRGFPGLWDVPPALLEAVQTSAQRA